MKGFIKTVICLGLVSVLHGQAIAKSVPTCEPVASPVPNSGKCQDLTKQDLTGTPNCANFYAPAKHGKKYKKCVSASHKSKHPCDQGHSQCKPSTESNSDNAAAAQ